MGCRRVAPADELVRVVRRSDGTLDVGRTAPGRGAWLCRASPDCADAAVRKGALARALRGSIQPESAAALRDRQDQCARMGGRPV